MTEKKRKIALVGTAASGAEAPYDDDSWEIWGVAARCARAVRATRWFELHRLDGEPKDWADKWRDAIKTFSHDVDLYMFYPEPDLGPNVVQYPIDKIVSRFGTYFMTSSFSWMMALAIDEVRPQDGPPVECEIGIWGVDMEYGTEYKQQRAGFRHFTALASFLGIAINKFASSGLSYEPVPYPLWQDDPIMCANALRLRENEEQLKEVGDSLDKTRQMIACNNAVIVEREWLGLQDERSEKLEKKNKDLLLTSAELSKEITAKRGAYEEQCWLADYLHP